jgi:hypothetical protein
MLRSTLPAFLLVLAPLGAAHLAGPFQEPPPKPRTELTTEGDRVRGLMPKAYGGVDLLDGIRGFKFRLLPSQFEKQPDGSFLEKPGAPFEVEVDYRTGERSLRLEEVIDGQSVVRLLGRNGQRCFVGGKASEVPELLTVAQEQASSILQFLDVYLGPPSGRLPLVWDRVRERNGVSFYTFEARSALNLPMLLFIGMGSLRVERVDLFDPKTGQRQRSLRFEEFEPVGGLPMPRALRIIDRAGDPLGLWRFEALQLNPEFPEGRFEAL